MTSAAYHQITQTTYRDRTRTHRHTPTPKDATSPAEERDFILSTRSGNDYTANPDGSIEHTHDDGTRIRVWWELFHTPLNQKVFNADTVKVGNIITAKSAEEFRVTEVGPAAVTVRPVMRPNATDYVLYRDITSVRTDFGC